jgi:CubicO group peptidase (beta-lactamase class C family)
LLTVSVYAQPQPPQLANLPDTVNQALASFHTPGMSVGIIKDGKVVYLKGHGYRNLEQKLPVTAETYFRLGSTSKAFTAASVAKLVEDLDIPWNTHVTDILSDFQMQDPWVTREFTILDLLTHRSGLAGSAGDSMLWPEPGGFSRSEIIHNLRYLTPTSSFRSQYGYSNLMYITAGELVAAARQQPWDEIVEQDIMTPLNMQCFAGDIPSQFLANVAMSYGYDDKRGLYPIPRNQITQNKLISAAAGGVVCNAKDMLKWLQMWLDEGQLDNGRSLLDKETVEFMHSPQTILSVSDNDEEWDNTLFKAYGLGWRLADVEGVKVVSHTGTLSGFQASVALVPSQDLAIVLLNNGSNSGARGAVMQHILKAYLTPNDTTDWVKVYTDYQDEREQRYLATNKEPAGSGQVILDPIAYTGTFNDTWFGDMSIEASGNELRIQSAKMVTLAGRLEPYEDHTFVIRWDNQNAASDAFIHYEVNTEHKVTGFTLYPYTLKEKTSHEYSDMHFTRSE